MTKSRDTQTYSQTLTQTNPVIISHHWLNFLSIQQFGSMRRYIQGIRKLQVPVVVSVGSGGVIGSWTCNIHIWWPVAGWNNPLTLDSQATRSYTKVAFEFAL